MGIINARMIKDDLIIRIKNWRVPAWIQQLLYKSYVLSSDLRCQLKFGDRYFFRNAAIEISTKCNRQCGYCPNSKYPTTEKYMAESIFKKCLSRLKEIDFEGSLYFHFYNEPLLDKRLPELVAAAKKSLPKSMIRIFSNGDFLTGEIMDELVRSGVMELVITNHKPESRQWQKNISSLLRDWGKYISIQSLSAIPLSNRGGLVKVENQEKRKNCVEPLRTVQIDIDGNVILCCNDFHRAHKFGNIKETSLRKIWAGKKFAKLRKELRSGVITLPICMRCLNIDD